MKKITTIILMIIFFIGCKPSVNEKYLIQGDKIDGSAYLKNNDDELILLKDIKKPVLVFKYSELNCSVCIDSVVSTIKKLKNYKLNIIYVAEYKSKRDVIIFKRINNIDADIYKTNFKSRVDEYNFPYLYIIDEDMIQKSVYIPKKENLNAFNEYLSYIEDYYKEE